MGALTSTDETDHAAVGQLRLPRLTSFAASGLQIGSRNSRVACGFPSLHILLVVSNVRPRSRYSVEDGGITSDPAASQPGPRGVSATEGPEAALQHQ
jgi:hypothetical protein